MSYRKYTSLLFKSPRATLGGVRLLAANHQSDIEQARLSQILDEHVAALPSSLSAQDFPRVRPINIEGRDCYLRFYQTDELIKAARYLAAVDWASDCGIHVPPTLHTSFRRVAGRHCFAILEQGVAGTEIGHTRWSIERGERFADVLSRWHGVPEHAYAPIRPLLVGFDPRGYRRRLVKPPKAGNASTAEQRALIVRASGLLDKAELFKPLAVSHGDVNPHNVIEAPNGELAWVDLDMISYRPPWQDITITMCKLMNREDPAVVDAFERVYFRDRQAQVEQWWRIRRDWMFLMNVLEGVRWLAVDRTRRVGSGVADSDDTEPVKWAQQFFTQAQALADTADHGLDSGALIARISAA